MYFLTGKQWQFDSFYLNYTGPGTGTLEYVRGASNNAIDYDNVLGIYWPDGGYAYFDENDNYNAGSWSFPNPGDSINLMLVQDLPSYPTIYGRILKLDATHLNFYDSTNSTLDIEVYKP